MPQPADTLHLREIIQAYATSLPERDGQGRLKFTVQGEDQLAQLCDEIGQTWLPRRITFYSQSRKCLELTAANGRLYALRLDEHAEPIHCTAGAPADAEKALKTIERALAGCGTLSVDYDRLTTELDRAGPGVSPDAIRQARRIPRQVHAPNPRRTDEAAAELHISQSVVASATGDRARLADLKHLVEATHPTVGGWLEGMNDEVFEMIEIGTGQGQTIRLSYDQDGVRLQLF